ncbi:Abi family protein [Rummeliibacillus sp. TYF005]|uniref:Abi family protein n=1 Tax=Rummeliibacillus sp. TYF005 TaxID=2058214 RepID=UPI0013DE7406|nr:Abi family protein [Rummeliibacillus sp. TYF005]
MVTGKRTDGLMRHLRDDNGIDISGSRQKKELLSIGYYHGYKGYRFIKVSTNPIGYNDFDEVLAVYNFDMNLKTLLYPNIMAVETALKNYTLDTLVSFGNLDLETAFNNFLNDYRSHSSSDTAYKTKLKSYLSLRSKIDGAISHYYKKHDAIKHFLHNGQPIPLWAIFEVLDMGQFGLFLQCLNEPIRRQNCSNLNLTYRGLDPDGRLVEVIIFLLKDLRNAVAHNGVIFDCRFKGNTNAKPLIKNYVSFETSINNIDFSDLVDYFILIVLLLKKIGKTKTDLKRLIRNFKDETETLRNQIPVNIFNAIIGTDHNVKLTALEAYV